MTSYNTLTKTKNGSAFRQLTRMVPTKLDFDSSDTFFKKSFGALSKYLANSAKGTHLLLQMELVLFQLPDP